MIPQSDVNESEVAPVSLARRTETIFHWPNRRRTKALQLRVGTMDDPSLWCIPFKIVTGEDFVVKVRDLWLLGGSLRNQAGLMNGSGRAHEWIRQGS